MKRITYIALGIFLSILEVIYVRGTTWGVLSLLALLANVTLFSVVFRTFSPHEKKVKRKTNGSLILLFLAAVFIAGFFHFHKITTVPSDIYGFDVARDVEQVRQIVSSKTVYILFHNFSKEPLYYHLTALTTFFTKDIFLAFKVTAGMIGVLTTAILFLILYDFFKNSFVAFSTSLLFSFSSWQLVLERTAYRANLVPLIILCLIYALYRGIERKSYSMVFWGGILSGLGFYAYTTYWIVPIVVGFFLIGQLIRAGTSQKQTLFRLTMTAFFGFIIVMLPLFSYIRQEPHIYFQRMVERGKERSHLSSSEKIVSFSTNYIHSMEGVFTRGEEFPRYETTSPHRPGIEWPIIFFLLVGLSASLTSFTRGLYYIVSRRPSKFEEDPSESFILNSLAILLFIFAFIPTSLFSMGFTLETPNFSRMIVALPVLFLFIAVGIYKCYKVFLKRGKEMGTIIIVWAVFLIIVLYGSYSYRQFFTSFPQYYPFANFPIYKSIEHEYKKNISHHYFILFNIDPEALAVFIPDYGSTITLMESFSSADYGKGTIGDDLLKTISKEVNNGPITLFHRSDYSLEETRLKPICKTSQVSYVYSNFELAVSYCALDSKKTM